MKQGVITILAAGAFNPNEKVVVDGETISLAQYASRMNVQLLKPSDLNKRLQEHGVDYKITVQRICRIFRNEKQVRDVLDQIWKEPEKASTVSEEIMRSNKDVYEFEKQLQG